MKKTIQAFETVQKTIKTRKTEKVLASVNKPLKANPDLGSLADELLELAHWAPFHKPAHDSHRQAEFSSIVPWRIYVLEAADCRKLLETLKTWAKDDPSWLSGKIPKLLAAADLLFQVTWLANPDQTESSSLFEGNKENMEHIAATSSAIQNLLLGATALNLPNYWASGGLLLRPEIFDYLGIAKTEIVLGSIFIFPEETRALESVSISTGAWRGKQGEISDWSKKIKLG